MPMKMRTVLSQLSNDAKPTEYVAAIRKNASTRLALDAQRTADSLPSMTLDVSSSSPSHDASSALACRYIGMQTAGVTTANATISHGAMCVPKNAPASAKTPDSWSSPYRAAQ